MIRDYSDPNDGFRSIVTQIEKGSIKTRKEDVNRESRIRIPGPSVVTFNNPHHRMMFNPVRNQNPFLQLMEGMAFLTGHLGSEVNLEWYDYLDEGLLDCTFEPEYLSTVINTLHHMPETRSVRLHVGGAQDASLSNHVCASFDIPFHLGVKQLDMTVYSTMGDLVYDTFGRVANCFSFLQEYVAAMLGMRIGKMCLITNALYLPRNWEGEEYFRMDTMHTPSYKKLSALIGLVEDPKRLWNEATSLVTSKKVTSSGKEPFMEGVAIPIKKAYGKMKAGKHSEALDEIDRVDASDWAIACRNWIKRRMR